MNVIYVPRTLVEIASSNSDGGRVDPVPVALESVRDVHAYVLLGDPGMGKTTAFKQEAEAIGLAPIRARDFIGLRQLKEQWADKTLFIDGLDETRAGVQDGRTVLDQIRGKLEALGVPRFRISCREADWLGSSDRDALERLLQGKSPLKVFRLKKLSPDDIETLLSGNHDVADPTAFVHDAERLGLDGLLGNPQTLQVLAKAVKKAGHWPETKANAYHFACEQLADELNVEHIAAKQKSWPSTPSLLSAAGYLSAIYLCSNRSEIRLTANDGDNDALAVNGIVNTQNLPLRECLETNLFVGTGGNGRLLVHRSIAEYLGAKYLAQRIEDGVSVGRVLALLTGADGGVITSLRGLHAWLAACSATARSRLIEADPLGVLLYGDAKAFAVSEKKLLLRCLHRNAESHRDLRSADWSGEIYAALATPGMADEFKRILQAEGRQTSDQILSDGVVMALSAGQIVPGMAPVLLDVAQDASRWGGIRRYALRTYLKKYLESPHAVTAMLVAVSNGNVIDSDDELLGTLLRHLYPKYLTVEQVLDHLHKPKDGRLSGNYQWFWRNEFLDATSEDRLPELLDALSKRPRLPNSRGNENYWQLACGALARGLLECGGVADDQRLYRWLGVTLGERDYDHLQRDPEKHVVRSWLEGRPQRYINLLTIGLANLANESRPWGATARLHGSTIPAGCGVRLLALADQETRPVIADYWFNLAIRTFCNPDLKSGLLPGQFHAWIAGHADLHQAFRDFLFPDNAHVEYGDQEYEEAQKREKHDRIQQFAASLHERSHALVEVGCLYDLARAHLGHLIQANGATAHERLNYFFDGDSDLVARSLAALYATPMRTDLPRSSEVLDSYRKGSVWLLGPPLLVGLENLFQTAPDVFFELPEATLRAGLTVSYTYLAGGATAAWRTALATRYPEWVATAYVDYSSADIKARRPYVNGLQELAFDPAYLPVARIAIPSVLKKFPKRADVDQLFDLERLIKGLLTAVPATESLSFVRSKLTSKTLDVGQQTYWIAAGLLLAPKKYEKSIRKYVAQNEVRIGHLSRFLEQRIARNDLVAKLPISTLAILIELLGPNCRQERPSGVVYSVTPDMNRADLVRNWINQLSASPTVEARDTLGSLQLLPELAPWVPQLRDALASQTVVMRDATYRYPKPSDVFTTLSKGQPANVADLFAIINDELSELINDIEHSDLDAYKQFWNVDSRNTPTEVSKPEEACRDTLCTLLRERLKKYGVNCEIESRHADRKRSDVWCTHDGFGVPMEAKQQEHDEIWKSIQGQLVAKYSSDPRAHGYGIYLVFWFKGKLPKPPNQGKKPKTAAELKVRLEEQIAVDQRPFLSVHVLDLSFASRR